MKISLKGLFEKIKRLTKKKKKIEDNNQILVSSEIRIASVGEIKSLVNNFSSEKSNKPTDKNNGSDIRVTFDQPLIIERRPPHIPKRAWKGRPKTHHEKKLWNHIGPVEQDND